MIVGVVNGVANMFMLRADQNESNDSPVVVNLKEIGCSMMNGYLIAHDFIKGNGGTFLMYRSKSRKRWNPNQKIARLKMDCKLQFVTTSENSK